MQDRNTYSTKDLTQAAFLWTQEGARLEKASLQDERTLYFEFSLPLSPEKIQELLLKVANGETLVEPLQFVQNQVKIREILGNNLKRKHSGGVR